MTDVHTKEIRSYNMSRIKSKDTKPELIVRKFLFSKGYRYRLHVKNLPGKPDIVLSKYKTVIFIHGCFWHGHVGCKYYILPKTNTEWWLNKINKNNITDFNAELALESLGWQVIVIWECELKPAVRAESLNRILNKINSLGEKSENL